ncbi:MAG: TonB-dependent receptor [Prevotella sp.]|nr:TonB-dependent receptor [Prevotella sp.]
MKRILIWIVLICGFAVQGVVAQGLTLGGVVVDDNNRQPIEYASILLKESGQWAITDERGRFSVSNVGMGKTIVTVQCLGYETRVFQLDVKKDMTSLNIRLKQDNLKLDEVTVTAKRKRDEATTSYTIDRAALEQQQLINIGDIETLLPGGKTVNATLMNDDRMSLRSGSQERGNASFGTAIEVDGVRIDNNSAAAETVAASTRGIATSNVESVEVVTGIASVEYGDLSNGIVKVNTRRGKSPFIVEGKINQHTRQVALNKGFELGHHHGVLNTSFEHARSFGDAASPHTAYQRNVLSLNYMNVFMASTMPLTLNVGMSGNMGGYDSKADPDEELDDYTKTHDRTIRGNFSLNWLVNKPWLTSLFLSGSVSYADRKTEGYTHAASASTQPYIHATDEGYHIAEDYDINPLADIILGPTGYWYVRRYHDSKPFTWSLKLRGESNQHFALFGQTARNHIMAGMEYGGSRNIGAGVYYEDMRYAPTWREYRYDALPSMHNVAFYIEDKVGIPTGKLSTLEVTAGLRDDITMIGGSSYGTVSSLSPRVNSRYIFWRERRTRTVRSLSIHAGWGRSVKLPSFQVLYPSPSYTDRLAFASTSTLDNKSYYAFHTYPTQAIYNPDLRWQYTHQTDIGIEADIKGTRLTISAFRQTTHRPYMSEDVFMPMTYNYTPPSSLDGISINPADRKYSIDGKTGIVSVEDASGKQSAHTLAYNSRNTYAVSSRYVNGSPVTRYGLEWVVDFAQIKALRTSLRLDGNYYYYKSVDETLFADIPQGVNTTMSGSTQPYQYVGWYRGSNVTGAGSPATASVANGSLSRQANLNATVTTHIPQIRLIVSLRIEASLYNYRRLLCQQSDGTRGYVLANSSEYTGEPYDGSSRDRLVAVYPEYYSTWDNPTEKIPFAETFLWAKDNDPTLYDDLAKLVVRTNYPYIMNPDRISRYYSANLSVTKEIGNHISVSFYANNFINTMKKVKSSQTGLETSLFGSSYVPSYYYGLSLRLKI